MCPIMTHCHNCLASKTCSKVPLQKHWTFPGVSLTFLRVDFFNWSISNPSLQPQMNTLLGRLWNASRTDVIHIPLLLRIADGSIPQIEMHALLPFRDEVISLLFHKETHTTFLINSRSDSNQETVIIYCSWAPGKKTPSCWQTSYCALTAWLALSMACTGWQFLHLANS